MSNNSYSRPLGAMRTLLATSFILTAFASTLHAGSILKGFETSYSVTLSSGVFVENIQLIERAQSPVFGDIWSGGGPQRAVEGPNFLNGFVYDYPGCPCLPLEAVLGGIQTDALGQQHFVLFMSNAAASLAAGVPWETSFPGMNESDLITGFPDGTLNFFSFVFAARTAIKDANGQPVSALFRPGEDFTVLSWSDGLVVGSGTSKVTALYETVVPEPGSGVGLALGILVLSLLRLSRRN